jgi:hypothetical protein
MIYDFVIIGTGPAGATLAWKLSSQGFKVALIDRANHQKKQLINDFFCPYVNNTPNFYTPVYSDQLGGNSALWHGKIYLISEKEYNESKWGFGYDELKYYSSDLAKKLKIENKKFSQILNQEKNIYHYSYRSDLKNIFKYLDLMNNDNVDIFEGYSPVKLNFIGKKVDTLDILSCKKKLKKISIKNSLIFCAGGLGNPHLLMNLFPNQNTTIGKYLSDHTHVNLCKINSNEMKKYINILKPNIKNNLRSDNLNKKEELAQVFESENFFAGVQLDYKIDPMRRLRRSFLRINNIYIRKILTFFSFFILKLNGLIAKFGILFNKYYQYSFEFYFSQHQDSQNYIKLDKDKFDNFGLNKINITWDLTEKDKNKMNLIIEESVGNHGKLFKSNQKIDFIKNFYDYGLVGLHPSCTTKIGMNQSDGVVDSNLKLFDYNNVYVCGSSIFPENGFTNPTWTIMTLSSRLSSFLSKKINI